MRNPELSFPEVLFIVGTRAALAAGVALLVSDRLSRSQRRSIGTALLAVGAATTVPRGHGALRPPLGSGHPPGGLRALILGTV